jgi:hypothetical protein
MSCRMHPHVHVTPVPIDDPFYLISGLQACRDIFSRRNYLMTDISIEFAREKDLKLSAVRFAD